MDRIRQRLAHIDRQLERGIGNYHGRVIATAPLLPCAAGLIAGIIGQNYLTPPVRPWLMLPAGLALAALICLLLKRKVFHNLPAAYVTAYLAMFCCICLGAVRLYSFNRPADDDVRNLVGPTRTLATVRGTIVTRPYINRRPDWDFHAFQFTDSPTSFYLDVVEVKAVDGWRKASGRIRVQVNEPVMDLNQGDFVRLYCWLDRFTGATNPGQFDIAEYTARKGVYISAFVPTRDAIEMLAPGGKGLLARLRNKAREIASAALADDIPVDSHQRGLVEALLLGCRANIDSETYLAFRRTGLLHFISLSGMHLGILIGVVWWLSKVIGLMKPARAAVCLIALGLFLLVVPPRDPTLRAAIIAAVYCLSFFFNKRPSHFNSLSLAAIILLLLRPTALFEAGWQLSFASVTGILLFCQRFHLFLYELLTSHSWLSDLVKTKPFNRVVSLLGSPFLEIFSTGLSGWILSAPVLLYHFHTINWLTSLWTALTFPFVALILTLGFFKILLSFLLPSAAALLALLLTFFAWIFILLVKLFAHLNISEILIGHPPARLIVLYYALVLFAGFSYFKRPAPKRIICTILTAAILLSLGTLKWQRTHRPNLIITALDVGHGQAVLAQLPGTANILFDAGSLNSPDVGSRIILPFLQYRGTNRIDTIFISHNDIDHINAIPELAEECSVGRIFANEAFFASLSDDRPSEFLAESLSEDGFEIEQLPENPSLKSPATVNILWPSPEAAANTALSDNDKSTVSLIRFGQSTILICSDIEQAAQRWLLNLHPQLKADVVIAPHHGSVRTLDRHFLDTLGSQIVICSCGRTDLEKHRVIQPTTKRKILYTPADGTVTVSLDSKGRIETAAFTPK